MEYPETSCVSRGKFEPSSDDYQINATEFEAPAFCSKFNIHCQRGEDCQIHVRCVDTLRAGDEEQRCTRNEKGKHENIEKLSEDCINARRIKEIQASIWQLRRVCVLGDVKWTREEPRTRACNYVHAITRPRNDVIERSMSILPEASERVRSKGLGGSLSMLVDTFVDESVRRNIASSIRCDLPANSCDPEKLNHYYECVAEFGFNHIIVIGEMLYGLLFLDCYGRVFQWENMEQVLWPMGDSLEDSKTHEDLVVWTVEDDVVYEESKDSLEPRETGSVKGTKNNRSKKKKKR